MAWWKAPNPMLLWKTLRPAIPDPPARLVKAVGGGDFRATGAEFFRYFVEIGGLQPQESVLDVGCGCGRMAAPLARYLEKGSYEGFDIDPRGIRWAKRQITSRHPQFGFQVADLYSKVYNPRGRFQARTFRFPYKDEAFDFIIVTSVFTHLLRAEVEHYLDEIKRVSAPGARCLATFFLLNEDSTMHIANGESSLAFPHTVEATSVKDAEHPEGAVAFPESVVREMFAVRGFIPNDGVQYGTWCGRGKGLSYQDIIVAKRN